MNFALIVILNAVLFIRPAELFPALSLPLYQIATAACLVLGFPRLLEEISPRNLLAQPISICVVGVMISAVLSNLARFDLFDAWTSADHFFKVLLYYFLLTGMINTADRMRWFLMSLVACMVFVSSLAILDYYGIIDMPTLIPMADGDYLRMVATGLFGDPNDFCLAISMAIILCVYFMLDVDSGLFARAIWAGPLAILIQAMRLTYSRGGLFALLAGVGIYLVFRFGKKTVPIALVSLPALLMVAGGRQAEMDLGGGTGQARVQLWDAHMQKFRSSPIFGIGFGNALDNPEEADLVAHNSFVSAYEELGFFGGTFFLATLAISFWQLRRLGPPSVRILEPRMARLRPFLAASVVCTAVGLMSLTRHYAIPTYNVLGLVVAYLRIAKTDRPAPPLLFDWRLVLWLTLMGVGFLIIITLLIRRNVHYN